MTITAALIILLLIALNGLFVAAEFAIVGAPRPAIDRLARQGNRAALVVRRILHDPRAQDRYIATAQLGITLASLGLGMYGEHLLAAWLATMFEGGWIARWVAAHTVASIIAVTALTYLHVVLGEMVPKSLALQRAERTVLWVTPLMRAIQVALFPLVVALNGIGNTVIHLVGIRRDAVPSDRFRNPEELAYLVRETAAGGLLRRESANVVEELFAFGELTARDVMVPRTRVVGVRAGASVAELHRVLRRAPHTRYPVYERNLDRIIGVIHVKDILRALTLSRPLSRENVRRVPFVPPSGKVDQVLAAMAEAPSQLAVVLDEHGGTAGILTVEDLFEEVVGEIGEDPTARPELYRDDGGVVRARGTVRLEEVGELLGAPLEHPAVDTMGGLVLALLGRPPRVGDTISYGPVRLEVSAVEGRGATEIALTLDSPPPSDGLE